MVDDLNALTGTDDGVSIAEVATDQADPLRNKLWIVSSRKNGDAIPAL